MSYLNNCSLRIVGGRERSGGYVDMSHGQKYSLQMRNDREERCDARVEIDGQHVGTWRINRRQTINIDRPAHDTGQFTFYRLFSEEASKVQLNSESPDLGLVKVTFTPEIVSVYQAGGGVLNYSPTFSSASFDLTGITRGAGGTGLSGQSRQRFADAAPLNYDRTQETVIMLRLVYAESNEPRPLTAHSTPYPPRIA